MYTIQEAAQLSASVVGLETHRLALHAARVPPAFVLAPAYEEGFYRTTNLPEQLGRLFAGVNPARIDEDDLERRCGHAQVLVRGSSLLDDSVQLFYRALANATLAQGELHVRRPDTPLSEVAVSHPPGSEALHALKRLWVRDWRFEAVLARLDDSGSVALEARPTLIIAGPPGQPDPARAEQLGVPQASTNALGLVGLP